MVQKRYCHCTPWHHPAIGYTYHPGGVHGVQDHGKVVPVAWLKVAMQSPGIVHHNVFEAPLQMEGSLEGCCMGGRGFLEGQRIT